MTATLPIDVTVDLKYGFITKPFQQPICARPSSRFVIEWENIGSTKDIISKIVDVLIVGSNHTKAYRYMASTWVK